MPKIFNDEEMILVFNLINQGTRIKDVSKMIGKTPYEVNQLYKAAERRTWPHYQKRMGRVIILEKQETKIERVKGEYSNKQYV